MKEVTNINYLKTAAALKKKLEEKTWHVHITGMVQGVGFRPFVYQLAKQFQIKGWVNNSNDGVHIEFNADSTVADQFYKSLLHHAPALSAITNHYFTEINHQVFYSFEIMESQLTEESNLLLTPDFGICEDCKYELTIKDNRRYHYPFITCTQCGPRYSIIKKNPYDRDNTTMNIFEMCENCDEEYHDPINSRHFSQTNSCPDCAITMQLLDKQKNSIEEDQTKLISAVCELWEDGKIVAIKGIGGYLLTCDASNEAAIKELRRRKHRPSKPFALMFPDITVLQNEVYTRDEELSELKTPAAPIVLLKLKNRSHTTMALEEIAPGLSSIGAMLPYTALYVLLMKKFNKPIVATSGNVTNAAIIFRDSDALNELTTIADYLVINNRDIIVPQDDSVVKYTTQTKQRIMLRRARGFAPLYINDKNILPPKTILATGALLKSSFTLLHHKNIHVSQYLGNTDHVDAQNNFENTLNHFLRLFKCRPEIIIADKHPDYFSSHLAERLSKEWNIPLIKVQHHEAHFAAVLAENNLLNEVEPVLGVVWDGTGLGDDGHIWGGDFFVYHKRKLNRIHHFTYFNWFLGDKMAKEPRLSALSLCYGNKEAEQILKSKFSTIEWNNYHLLLSKNQLKTSSMGRIFDAIASLLGLNDISSYEGEAAMMLTELALNFFQKNSQVPAAWLQHIEGQTGLDAHELMSTIIKKINSGIDKAEIAAWFHVQLALIIKRVANENNCVKVCCSGGVFQNEILVDLLAALPGEKITLYYNKDLPCNDENISFGQLNWYLLKENNFNLPSL